MLKQQTLHESHSQQQRSSLVVVGVALVVDQLGKGPRTVLRYPTAPLIDGVEDLFFRLPARQIAKLFRPKPALCGQPMTLSVGGTVFCCCATLMADEGVSNNNEANEEEDNTVETKDHLTLFSVIVALAPKSRTFTTPISGWIAEGNTTNINEVTESQIQHSLSVLEGKLGVPGLYGSRASSSFLSVQRVHVSLARLCRVLEREERRCRYVSIQSDLFRQIRSDVQKRWQEQQFNKSSATPKTSSTATSPVSMASISVPVASERKPRHRRTASFSREMMVNDISSARAGQSGEVPVEELEQEAMEIILAAAYIPDGGASGYTNTASSRGHMGNLAQDLAQTFHALGRNDHDFPHPPLDLLTGQGGIVYVNGHMAVAIEAVSPYDSKFRQAKPIIRPYHTLLFPLASPSQLLDSLKVSGSAGPRRLQQFLLMVSPQKSLKETAADANLPLQAAVEIAAYLVGQGACLASPVLSRNSRLACHSIDKIQEELLAFSQTFGPSVNLFVLVSFLTDSRRTLGESMTALTTSTEKNATLLREHMESSLCFHAPLSTLEGQPASPSNVYPESADTSMTQEELRRADELEEIFFKMVTWLRSRLVLNHLLDFLVCSQPTGMSCSERVNDEAVLNQRDRSEKKVDGNHRVDGISDDVLFKELMDSNCLDGMTSLQSCGFRVGLDTARIRGFALRHDQIRIVSRVPCEGDDW